MSTKLLSVTIRFFAASLLISGCGPGQLFEPTVTPTAAVTPTLTLAPPPTKVLSPVEQILSPLKGLEFDVFIEESYKLWLLRDPESVALWGLTKTYGIRNNHLTDISDSYIRETQQLELGILALLEGYDRSALAPEQQLTYDIYAWWLDDLVRGHTFMYHNYPIGMEHSDSFNNYLPLYFTDILPVTNEEEAQDYIACLMQVNAKIEQLIDGLKRRAANGVITPRFLILEVIDSLQGLVDQGAMMTPYYTSFADKVNLLAGVSDIDRQALLDAAVSAIDDSVIPGYKSLVSYLHQLSTVAKEDVGVWQLPDGEAYYTYLLHHHISADLSVDEIFDLGSAELELIHAEMRAAFDQLGYPSEASLEELHERVYLEAGSVGGDQIVAIYETIINRASESTAPAFDLLPTATLEVVSYPIGGFYLPPARDGSHPGIFYVPEGGSSLYSMPALAHHEAIPGHHFQIAIAQELNLPILRQNMTFTGYVEGWALYGERLAWELGLYKDDPYGNLGRLQAQAMRAARLVVDTGIHSKKWTYDQALQFIAESTGYSTDAMRHQISRYVLIPGQADSYYIGYLKILELRQRAMDELGDKFDIKIFHNAVLGNGAVPLTILDKVVDDYIAATKRQ